MAVPYYDAGSSAGGPATSALTDVYTSGRILFPSVFSLSPRRFVVVRSSHCTGPERLKALVHEDARIMASLVAPMAITAAARRAPRVWEL